mgnify:CR=1 FL=1
MFGKSFIVFLIFVILSFYCSPVFATDSVFVWSEGVTGEAISTASVVRW